MNKALDGELLVKHWIIFCVNFFGLLEVYFVLAVAGELLARHFWIKICTVTGKKRVVPCKKKWNFRKKCDGIKKTYEKETKHDKMHECVKMKKT